MPTEHKPIECLARRTEARNARFAIHFDHIRCGDNEVPQYLVVESLTRTVEGVTGIAVLPFVDGRVLLQRMYRHPIGRWGWEVPRGFVDEGETAVAAAVRELAEEAGYVCPAEAFALLHIML